MLEGLRDVRRRMVARYADNRTRAQNALQEMQDESALPQREEEIELWEEEEKQIIQEEKDKEAAYKAVVAAIRAHIDRAGILDEKRTSIMQKNPVLFADPHIANPDPE